MANISWLPPAIWKQAPFLRLVIPFIIGILLQWNYQPSCIILFTVTIVSFILGVVFFLFTAKQKFQYYWISGTAISLFFISGGALLTYYKNGLNCPDNITHHYQQGNTLQVTLQEPLSEKAKTYKAIASVEAITDSSNIPVRGNIILYFKKDSSLSQLSYGSQLLVKASLQLISNSGNPGSFDYKRYCNFQDIYYQAYITPADYVVLPQKNTNNIKQWLFNTQKRVVQILSTYIPGNKESGLAEALLIGYKGDLDKELVQAYTNTGVVHIIAISGLHLALVYGILLWLLKPISNKGIMRIAKPIVLIVALWAFSLLTGASASVMRAAVMFTCVVAGSSFSRKISIYNTLSLSALLLLIYNPFYLWDVGFQLSYIAVLSIVLFMRPVYNLLQPQNKLLGAMWQLAAVSVAAQILTTPISIYQFHQFPNLFWLTNIIAVPLSNIILVGEILLCVVSFCPPLAKVIGWLLSKLIWCMNSSIEQLSSNPLALWSGLQINTSQLILMYTVILFFSWGIFYKNKRAVFLAMFSMLAIVSIRFYSYITLSQQQSVIVYNIPNNRAIDIVEGFHYRFIADSAIRSNIQLQNLYLTPARILNRTSEAISEKNADECIFAGNKKILLLNRALSSYMPDSINRIRLDALVVSHNPTLYMEDVVHSFDCGIIVFDASNPDWKVQKWKADCERLQQPCYSVKEQGAFILNGKP